MLLPPCMPTNSRRRRHHWPWRILGMCGLCVFIFGIIGARQRACDCGQCTQCLCGFAPPAEGWAHRTKWCKSVNTVNTRSLLTHSRRRRCAIEELRTEICGHVLGAWGAVGVGWSMGANASGGVCCTLAVVRIVRLIFFW